MCPAADQVADENRDARHPKGLLGKTQHLFRFEMMEKEGTGNDVETTVRGR